MSGKRIYLKEARRRLGLTQAQLAARVHKHQSFISKLETGKKPEATMSEVVALARVLEVDPLALRFSRECAA